MRVLLAQAKLIQYRCAVGVHMQTERVLTQCVQQSLSVLVCGCAAGAGSWQQAPPRVQLLCGPAECNSQVGCCGTQEKNMLQTHDAQGYCPTLQRSLQHHNASVTCTHLHIVCVSLAKLHRPPVAVHTHCREEIASCSEAAYSNLRLADAQKLMMFKSPKEAEAYAKQVGSCCHCHTDRCTTGRRFCCFAVPYSHHMQT